MTIIYVEKGIHCDYLSVLLDIYDKKFGEIIRSSTKFTEPCVCLRAIALKLGMNFWVFSFTLGGIFLTFWILLLLGCIY